MRGLRISLAKNASCASSPHDSGIGWRARLASSEHDTLKTNKKHDTLNYNLYKTDTPLLAKQLTFYSKNPPFC